MNSLLEKASQAINEYYIEPILQDSGYNVVNTITWAIILGICIFGVVKLLKKMDIKITDRFVASVIPFILAGSSLRVIEDSGSLNAPLSYLFITPTIYFVVFFITVMFLIMAKWIHRMDKSKDFHKIFAYFGSGWFLVNVIILLYLENVELPWVPIFVIGAASLILYLAYILFDKIGSTMLKDKLNLSILWVHLLDASSTIAGIDFLGYYEKHVVPAYLIDLTGTAFVMYPLKLFIFISVIYVLDKEFNEDDESKTLRTFLKLVIIVLGLAPACRNTIRMTLGI
ncbi:DUF63 family protein [Methanolobus sp. ZRKC3]|uniref:DUF63 family protein n=1 Tax=Methanolobus sp. ZRKC3 TaxID=3125786 RepID=UPI003252C63F